MKSQDLPGSARRCAGRGRQLLAAALALPAGILLAEAIVRCTHLAPVPQPEVEGFLVQASADPILRFVNEPGARMTVAYRDNSRSAARLVAQRINADGWRGPEIELRKPADGLRIACLGDSHTFGYGVGEGQAWPDVLRSSIALRRARVEVLNCGVCGYDTEQEAALLERRVLAFLPDVVLLGYYLNDTALRDLPLADEAEPGWVLKLWAPRRPGWLGALRKKSELADYLADHIWRRASLSYFARSRSLAYAEGSPPWKRVSAAIERMQDRLEARGLRLGVVLIPYLVREHGQLASHEAFQLVLRFCRERRIPCLDLEPVFAPLDVDALRLHAHDFHAGPVAHALIGERVAARVEEQGWLEAR